MKACCALYIWLLAPSLEGSMAGTGCIEKNLQHFRNFVHFS